MEALLRRWISRRRRCSVQQPFKVEKEEQARRSKQVNPEEDSRCGARLFTATRRGVWGQRRCTASTRCVQAEPVGSQIQKTKGAANTTSKMRLKPKLPPYITPNLWLVSEIFLNQSCRPKYHLQFLLKDQSIILNE